MDFSAALPTFAIALREGVEAALVVGIVLACLKKAQQSHLNPWVYWSVVLGIAASALVGVLLSWVLQGLETADSAGALVLKPVLEGSFGLIAIALLSWMLIWMTQQARSLKSAVEGAVTQALQQTTGAAAWGVFSLCFIAVLREGIETVLFIIARFQQGWAPAIGALAGLLVATGIGVLLFQWGVKINLRLFFQIMGGFLLLIVAGLLISMLRHFDAAARILAQLNASLAPLCFSPGPTCILGPQLWDASQVLPDKQFPGILLKTLFGYRQQIYLAQAVSYIVFLLVVGGAYFRSFLPQGTPAVAQTPTPSEKGG